MAASRKLSGSEGAGALATGIEARLASIVDAGARVTVALSGGLDSVVLLDCLARLRERPGLALEAIHIDHGLSFNSGAWGTFCTELCRALDVPLRIVAVDVDRGRGESLEAAARRARYHAFRQHVTGILVLAHHLDDQAETLLLQLLRGAGPRGASAMPWLREAHASRDASAALVLVRPLLGVPRSRLEAYARASGLTWVEDESNADVALDRNYLRAHVMPEIERRFPGYRKALARSAELFREASALLDELSALDAADAICDGALDVATLRRLSEPRARNLLRCFLREGGVEAPPARRLEETIRQLLHARDDRHVRVLLGTAELCCDHGRVRLRPLAPVRAAAVRWRGEEVLAAPGGLGEVVFTCAEGAGISRQRIVGRQVELRSRRGGERIQPDCRRPRRTLKKLLQEHRIEVWERARLPLLYCDEHLVWAPAIGVDCAWQAGPGEPGMLPVWRLEATQGGIARSGPLQSRDY